jgi:uncharacterized membrane protein YdcZ (DUF606 family)
MRNVQDIARRAWIAFAFLVGAVFSVSLMARYEDSPTSGGSWEWWDWLLGIVVMAAVFVVIAAALALVTTLIVIWPLERITSTRRRPEVRHFQARRVERR